MDFDAQAFLQQGHEWVPTDPIFDAAIARVMARFLDFLAQPQEVKDRYAFDLTFNGCVDPEPDHGYIRKGGELRPDGTRSDVKEEIHFRPSWAHMLNQRGVDHSEWTDFFLDMAVVYKFCEASLANVIIALDDAFMEDGTGQGLVRRYIAGEHMLRLVTYKRGTGAQEHTDKSALTMHLYENNAGLLLDGVLTPAREGQKVVFGGRKLAQYFDRPELAKKHDTFAPEGEVRYAMAFFGHILI